MAEKVYWQAKIWALLKAPIFKILDHTNPVEEEMWRGLECMAGWSAPQSIDNPTDSHLNTAWLQNIGLSGAIAAATDRSTIDYLETTIHYGDNGIELSHLLSGAKFHLNLTNHAEIVGAGGDRHTYLRQQEIDFIEQIPAAVRRDAQSCFWWLWRCLPEIVAEKFGAESLLMPADSRLPDASMWSHVSMTAAIAGALAGYKTERAEVAPEVDPVPESHPYLAVFTFSPIQQLIKASRKMKDFWAGSWVLHYLSAKICWRLAHKYGPDCFLYPSLYGQPLIDHWLLQKDWNFEQWIKHPEKRQLLTAGFPNVIMLVLPEAQVAAAMQSAKNFLLTAWREIAEEVFKELQGDRHWQKSLKETDLTWQGWLNAQWQTYWSAMAIGGKDLNLTSQQISANTSAQSKERETWIQAQNKAFNAQLFTEAERDFFEAAIAELLQKQNVNFVPGLNVGSWWADVFKQTRFALNSVKNARNWRIPTAFGTRSSISGLGPVVHPTEFKDWRHRQMENWFTESDAKECWRRDAGLFDGIEQLNATETVKRTLEKVLPKILGGLDNEAIAASYPDLTSGVAGYLNTGTEADQSKFEEACQQIYEKFPWTKNVIRTMLNKWGIPKMDKFPQKYHPRLLNAGWLTEDFETSELRDLEQQLQTARDAERVTEIEQLKKQIRDIRIKCRQDLQKEIDHHYPQNNPANWYAIAAGDGDGMGEWLKGTKMQPYGAYFPDALEAPEPLQSSFARFKQETKRMGPATHNALSRALLDFSNQLAPHLTEERYAGRLIYSGGDDVLAYTNLWEWDRWLWDIRQAFRGQQDDQQDFESVGDYWRYVGNDPALTQKFKRPLFTMGKHATISFGLILAHHSVPLAIALEHLWEAENGAKKHESFNANANAHPSSDNKKDAVQVRVIYGNGNVLSATSKFATFRLWQQLIEGFPKLEASLFEQAAQMIMEHPIPNEASIEIWVRAFTNRREQLKDLATETATQFSLDLSAWIKHIWQTNQPATNTSPQHLKQSMQYRDQQLNYWLKIAAFVKRNRHIKHNHQTH